MKTLKLSLLAVLTAIIFQVLSCKKEDDSSGKMTPQYNKETVTDIDGNVYHTVTIGTQVWMVENLRVTHYRNGTDIPFDTLANISDNNYVWETGSGMCCIYNNDTSNLKTYGLLYTWYAAISSDGLAPEGWHVPSNEEFLTLNAYLGEKAGCKMREEGTAHWQAPNTGATNESGFTALAGGNRNPQGIFINTPRISGGWWQRDVSTANSSKALVMTLVYNVDGMGGESQMKGFGFSVRCIKDYAISK